MTMVRTLVAASLCLVLVSVGIARPNASPADEAVPYGKKGLGEVCKSAADCKGNLICRAPKKKSSPKYCYDPKDKTN
jgi:hypothetical protein